MAREQSLFRRRSLDAPFVIYLSVLPAYRAECIRVVRDRLGKDLAIFVSESHLDRTVKTGINPEWYTSLPIWRLGSIGYVQLTHWREAIGARATLVDLNPRSLSAWILLAARKALGRRTVVWGHLHGRGGAHSSTAPLRRLMRSMADGFVAYTYANRDDARRERPAQPVWVAPNSLYSHRQLSRRLPARSRRDAVYVGRFEPAKKVRSAVRAFAIHAKVNPDTRLILVGGGSEEQELRRIAQKLGIADRVIFRGWINDFDELNSVYSTAFCSLSPGFIGLGLTQSFGFGVPMIASRDEPHSPEVELADGGGVVWFETDNESDFARKLDVTSLHADSLPDVRLRDLVITQYSAESMADGLVRALRDVEE